MRQELQDIGVELATKTVPAGALTMISSPWWLTVNWTGVLTGVLIGLQILYLIRKWWREESEWGIKLKRWAESRGLVQTRPMGLDE